MKQNSVYIEIDKAWEKISEVMFFKASIPAKKVIITRILYDFGNSVCPEANVNYVPKGTD